MILCSKLKNGLCKIVTKSQVVTKFNVTKSRLHCIGRGGLRGYSLTTLKRRGGLVVQKRQLFVNSYKLENVNIGGQKNSKSCQRT